MSTKKQRSLISENDKLNHQRHLFEEESNKLNFFINNETVDIVWIFFSGTFMATKRSTLGLRKDSILANQFDHPLWAQQDKTTPEKDWSCEEVTEWVTTIEGMPDGIGTILLGNNVDGSALLILQ